MSALDLFITAMGSFAILMMILYPYFKADRKEQAQKKKEEQGNVLFCVWATRVQDYEQFYKETEPQKDPNRPGKFADSLWQNPGHEQKPDFPVVAVNWEQAQEFCQWLTKKERAAGLIQPEDEYRLPTLAEWRRALGPTKYPWGDAGPPPENFGNLGGLEQIEALHYAPPKELGGYRDKHELVAPVGSYPPNRDGLFDLLGNVQQWGQDWFRLADLPEDLRKTRLGQLRDDGGGNQFRVYLGAAWDDSYSYMFRTENAIPSRPTHRLSAVGFRCVLVINSPPKP